MADLLLGVKIGVQGGPQSVKEIKAIDDQVRKLQEQNARVAATAKALSESYDLNDVEVGQLINKLQQLEDQTQETSQKAKNAAQQIGEQYNLSADQVAALAKRLDSINFNIDKDGKLRNAQGQFIKIKDEVAKLDGQLIQTSKSAGALEIAIGNFGADLARRGVDAAIGAAQSLGQALTDTARQALQTGQEFDTAAGKVNTLGVDSAALATEIQSLTGRLEGQANSVELLGSAYDVISAGFSDVSDVSGILEAATKGAVGGFSDTLTVADALTSTLQAYNLSADQAASLTDKFIQTQNAGKITVDQYAQQIGKVASIAAQAGVGIDELNGFIATATAKGVLVESAFTGLRQAIANTLKPSSESAKFAKELGINFGATALQTQGLSGILGELNAKGLDSSENLIKLFGSVEAVAAISPSAGAGFAQLTKNIDDGANSAGAADSAFSTMATTVERLQVAIGNQLTEGFLALGQALRPIQDAFIEFASSLLNATAEGVTGLDLITQAGERLRTVLQENPQIAEQLGAALANLANVGIEQFARLIDGLSGFLANADNIDVLVSSLGQVADALQAIGDSIAFLSGVTNFVVSLNRSVSDLVPAFDGFLKVLTDIALALTPLGQAASLGQSIVQTFKEVDAAIVQAAQRVQGLIDRFLQLIGLPGFEAIARKIGLIDDSVRTTFSGSGKDLAGNLTGAFDSLEKSAAALPKNLAASADGVAASIDGVSDAVGKEVDETETELDRLTRVNREALNDLEVQAAQAQEALIKSGGDPAKLAQAEKTSLEQRIAENKKFLENLKGLKGLEGDEAAKVADQIRQTELTLANDRVALARQVLDAKVKAAEEAAEKEVDALKKARDAEKETATTEFRGQQTAQQDQFNDEERNRQQAFNDSQQADERAFNESERQADRVFQERQQAAQRAFQQAQQAKAKRFQAELDARRERGNREFDALGKEVDRRLQLQQASGSERAKLQKQFQEEDKAARERRKIEQQVLNERGQVLAGQGDLLELSPLEQARQQFEQGLQAEQEAFQLRQQEAERAFQEQQRLEEEAYQATKQAREDEFQKYQREQQKLFDDSEREIQRAFEAQQQAAEAAFNEQQRQLDEASAQRQAAILEAASRGIAPLVQARKDGGPVAAGQTYLVGEQGPELITPSRKGWVHTAGETAALLGKQPTMLVKNPAMPGIEAKLSELLQEVKRGRRVAVPTSYTLNTVNPLEDAISLQIKQVRALARGRVL